MFYFYFLFFIFLNYQAPSVADPEFHNGGRTVEGDGSGEGAVPPPQKKNLNFYLKMVGFGARITFYGYAKIGQVNEGGRQPPAPLLIRHWAPLTEFCS